MALLDAPSVSVPYESLKRVTRDRKYAIEELEGVLRGVQAAAHGGAPAPVTTQAALACLQQFEQQLQGLKRKVCCYDSRHCTCRLCCWQSQVGA